MSENRSSSTIMVVDDEPIMVEMIKDILESFEYKVEAFTSPILAIKAFNKYEGRYGLVISDVMMPEMSGIKFTSKIKDLNADIPIIISTGFMDKKEGNVMADTGADAFLRKPYREVDIIELVKKFLDK